MKKTAILATLLLLCLLLCSCAAKAVYIEDSTPPASDEQPAPDTPDEPVTTPDDPVTTPDEPVDTPDDPVDTPDEPVTTPDEPATTPDEPEGDGIRYLDESEMTVYSTCRANVRLAPVDGQIDGRVEWGTTLTRTGIAEVTRGEEIQEWWRIRINDKTFFISAECLSETKPEMPELYDVNKRYTVTIKINTYTDCNVSTVIEGGQLDKDSTVTVLKMSTDPDFHWAYVELADGKKVWITDRNMKLSAEPVIPDKVPEPVPVPSEPSTIYTNTKAYIRKGPSTSSGYIVLAHWGTPMTKKGTQGAWTIVDYNGQTGYIKTNLTMKTRTEEPPMSVINKTYTHTVDLALYTSCYMSSKVKDKKIPAGTEFFVIRASKYRGNHWTLVQLSDGSRYYIVDDYFIPYPYSGGYSRG